MSMRRSIFGLALNQDHAQRVVNHLLSQGFNREKISILSRDPNTTGHPEKRERLAVEEHSKAPEGGATGATVGGVLGGSLGLLAGVGALAIPGLGPFIAAGPIMAALSGSAVGGSLGLLIGTLVGSGISEYEAKRYEVELKSGKILISVETETEEELKRVQEIFNDENVSDITASTKETSSL